MMLRNNLQNSENVFQFCNYISSVYSIHYKYFMFAIIANCRWNIYSHEMLHNYVLYWMYMYVYGFWSVLMENKTCIVAFKEHVLLFKSICQLHF